MTKPHHANHENDSHSDSDRKRKFLIVAIVMLPLVLLIVAILLYHFYDSRERGETIIKRSAPASSTVPKQ